MPRSQTLRRGLSMVLRWAPLAVILAAGAWLRLDGIGAWPPGLYRDEAWYGLDAVGVLDGHPAVVFAANNGREGLFVYGLAASIAAFGRTAFALRVTAALTGIATLIAAYGVGRALYSHRVGVLTAGILAGVFWHVALSRVAFRAITLPLMEGVAITLCALALRASNRRAGALSIAGGAALGAVLYTYTSAAFLLPLVAAAGVVAAAAGGPEVRRRVAIMALAAGAAALPMAVWAFRHPELFLARAGQVSIFSPEISRGDPVGALMGNLGRALATFTLEGDRIWRHNLSRRPVFDGALGGAFWIGVVASLWHAVRSPAPGRPGRATHAFILAWLAVFLVPTVLAEDTPHFLRAIGAVMPACLIAAVGLEAALAFLSRRGFLINPLRAWLPVDLPPLIAAGVIAWGGLSTRNAYFDVYVREPLTAYWLEAQNTALAAEVNAGLGTGEVRLDRRLSDDNPALRFLVPELAQASRASEEEPGAVRQATSTLIVDPNHPHGGLRATAAPGVVTVREGPLAQGDLDVAPRRAYVVFATQPVTRVQIATATFDGGAALVGAEARAAPDGAGQLALTLRWRAAGPIAADDVVFVHWMRSGQVVAQADGNVLGGYWPMPAWRLGDEYLETRSLIAPGGWKPGDALRVGLYRRSDNQRRTILVGIGAGADAVEVAPQGPGR